MPEAAPLLAVIVPVYRVEDYLHQCIESIRQQSYPHLRIILVNDGSPYGADVVCRRYAELDPRVLFVSKENGGVSTARNEGLKYVEGCKYFTFVDSDDWLDKDFASLCIEQLEADSTLDTASCNIIIRGGKRDGYIVDKIPEGIYHRSELLKRYIRLEELEHHVCARVYRTERTAELRLRDGHNYGEDAIYTLELFLRTQKHFISDRCYYNYRLDNPSSATNTEKEQSGMELLLDNIYWMLERPDFTTEDKRYIATFYSKHLMRYWGRALRKQHDRAELERFFLHWANKVKHFPLYDLEAGRASSLRPSYLLRSLLHRFPLLYVLKARLISLR